MNKVREKRIELGLTQTDLAKRAGVTRQTISKLERETNSAPKVHWWTMKQVAAALGAKSITDIFLF